MTNPKIVILDFGSGNTHSVVNAFEEIGAEVELTSDRNAALNADGLVIPGVGAFETVMRQLRSVGGPGIVDQRLAAGRAVFGICVGLQVMFESGTEHGVETEGLGQWPGSVTKLDSPTLPHIGWNDVDVPSGSKLFEGISDRQFYFVHTYAAATFTLEDDTPFEKPLVSWSEYGSKFVAAVENGPLTATQFHPEKSGRAGLTLLNNWIKNL